MSEQSKSLRISGKLRRLIFFVALLAGHPTQTTWIVGAVIFVSGILVHILTSGYLVRNTQLTQSGPYRFVRHPMYLANFLVDLSFAIISNNIFVMLVFIILFEWSYGARMDKEELKLRKLYPDGYEGYASTVRRIIPGPWKMPFQGQHFAWKNLFRNTLVFSRLIQFATYGFALGLWFHLVDIRKLFNPPLDKTSYILIAGIAVMLISGFAARRLWHKKREAILSEVAQ